jgi:type IV secretory pathway VirB10-like protein
MTSLERPLPLPVVVVILSAISVGGFAFGLKGAMDKADRSTAVSTAPLAEVSGVPVRDAAPVVAVAPPPPPVEAPKPEPVEVAPEAPAPPPVVEAPPSTPAPPVEKKPEPPPQSIPQRIEDLY